MKTIVCNKCGIAKDEIEFEYHYFKRVYYHICKECKSQTKSRGVDPGPSGEDLVRDSA